MATALLRGRASIVTSTGRAAASPRLPQPWPRGHAKREMRPPTAARSMEFRCSAPAEKGRTMIPPRLPAGHVSTNYFYWVQLDAGLRDSVAEDLLRHGVYTTPL